MKPFIDLCNEVVTEIVDKTKKEMTKTKSPSHNIGRNMDYDEGGLSLLEENFITEEELDGCCEFCGDALEDCTGYKCWIR